MDKVKVCLVGAGRAGMVHARNFNDRISNVTVTSVVDPQSEAKSKADELGANFYSDLELALEKDDFNAVCVGAPTFAHVEAVVKAAEAGKHILCEKPLSLTLKEAEKMVNTVTENDILFQIGFMRRFDTNYTKAKEIIENGEIGEPIMVKSVGRSPGSGTLSKWIADVEKSNGILAEVNSHDFDAIRWLAGSEFKEVFAYADNLKCPSYEEEYPDFYDTATVNIKFQENVLGMVDGCYPATYGYDARTEVLGTEGMIQIGSSKAHSVMTWKKDGQIKSEGNKGWKSLFKEAYLKEDKHFVECVLNNREPKVGIIDGKKAVEIVLAANESIKSGKPVAL